MLSFCTATERDLWSSTMGNLIVSCWISPEKLQKYVLALVYRCCFFLLFPSLNPVKAHLSGRDAFQWPAQVSLLSPTWVLFPSRLLCLLYDRHSPFHSRIYLKGICKQVKGVKKRILAHWSTYLFKRPHDGHCSVWRIWGNGGAPALVWNSLNIYNIYRAC